ncbi:hypothetical protein HGA88_06335 [Candidatus Roizmanbacteria bacterium]|nr:hypothetical protein [Candidatus Roizmanbacteria bacterium]
MAENNIQVSQEIIMPRPLERPQKKRTREMMNDQNAFTWESVMPQLKQEQQKGKTIVVTNGHFVLFHSGHNVSLEQAREVGMTQRGEENDDGVILLAIVNAGHQTELKDPVKASAQTDRDRALSVYDSRHSDLVVISEAPAGDQTLVTDFNKLRETGLINSNLIYVKGGDYGVTENVPPEARIVQESGGQFVIVDRVGGYSTSSQVDKMFAAAVKAGLIVAVPQNAR